MFRYVRSKMLSVHRGISPCSTRTCPCHLFHSLSSSSCHDRYDPLVLASRGLASLELVKIPTTDSQTTLVLIHALAEALDVVCARAGLRHLGGSLVGRLVLSREFRILGRGISGGGGAAAEPAADCVAD